MGQYGMGLNTWFGPSAIWIGPSSGLWALNLILMGVKSGSIWTVRNPCIVPMEHVPAISLDGPGPEHVISPSLIGPRVWAQIILGTHMGVDQQYWAEVHVWAQLNRCRSDFCVSGLRVGRNIGWA